jgi:hypothetical protein
MASPFSVFRKRQKFLMALMCLLAIIAFVFLPNMGNLIGGRGKGATNLVVVKTKAFGDLRQFDINRMRQERQKIRAVLLELRHAAGQDPKSAEADVNSFIGGVTEDALVEHWLRAKRAEEVGMVVNDETINKFLRDWTADRVKAADFEAAFKRMPAVSDLQFFNLMREELVARQLFNSFVPSLQVSGLPTATPSQRWDWYNRLHCKALIEAVPLPVADYVHRIDDPSDEELQKFFDEHKDNLPNPASPKPGFRIPQKVALEYFKADVETFTLPKSVTDAEIVEQYEKFKDSYDRKFKVRPTMQPATPAVPKEEKKAAKPGETKPKQEPKETKTPQKATPAAEPKEAPKPPKEPSKTEEKQPAVEKKEPGAPKETPKSDPKEPSKAKDAKGASSADRPSPFMLTAMQQTEKAVERTPPKPAAKPETPVKPEPPAVKDQKPAAKPETPTAKEQKPAAKEQKPAAKQPAPSRKPEDVVAELPPALIAEIRDGIAKDKAYKKIGEVFARLRKSMIAYQELRGKYDQKRIQLEFEKKPVPPLPVFDLEKLAKENSVSAGRTKLISSWEAQGTDIGDSLVLVQRSGIPVRAFAFQALPKLQPAMSVDDKAEYLFWKTEESKEDTPKLSDKGVREEVIRSWKMIQARSLAMDAAKKLQTEARKAAKPLKQVWRNVQVLRPAQFSWMTLGNLALAAQQNPKLTTLKELPMVGDDFMQTVFRLEPAQVGVAFNAPQTVVYVVRPSEFTPLYEVRWSFFVHDDFSKYDSIGAQDQFEILRAWIEEIKKGAGFEWGPGHNVDQAQERERSASRDQPVDEED